VNSFKSSSAAFLFSHAAYFILLLFLMILKIRAILQQPQIINKIEVKMRWFWCYISLAGLQFIIDRISLVFSQMYTTSQMRQDTHYLVTI
jgi:phage-related holin